MRRTLYDGDATVTGWIPEPGTQKKPKDLSACDRGCGEDGGVYDVCIRVCIR